MDLRPLGQRRADGVVLLRHRPRGAARALDRRADRPHAASTSRRSRRVAGMVVPALLYLAVNPSGRGGARLGHRDRPPTPRSCSARSRSSGPRCPTQLRVFLLTLTVFDDIGALWRSSASSTPTTLDIVPLVRRRRLPAWRWRCVSRVKEWRGPLYLVVGIDAVGGDVRVRAAPVDRRHGRRPARSPRVPPARGGRREARRARSAPSASRRCRSSAARPSCGLRARGLGQRAAAGAAAPVDELRHRPGVRARQRRRRPARRAARRRARLAGDLGRGRSAWSSASSSASAPAPARGRGSGLGQLPQGVGEGEVLGGAALVGHRLHGLAARSPTWPSTPRCCATRRRSACSPPRCWPLLVGWAVFRARRRRCRGERDGAPPMVLDRPVDPARDHIRGPVDAPLTLVEYGDFECPFCGRATGVVSELRERFGDELRYVFRHLPLTDVHPHAELAARGGRGRGAPGRASGRCTTGCSPTRTSSSSTTSSATPSALGLDVERFARDARRRATTPPACARTSRAPRPAAPRHADVLRRRPPARRPLRRRHAGRGPRRRRRAAAPGAGALP